jgi:thiamine-phosphate pyrophosphorylase
MKRLEDIRLYGILDMGYVGPAEVVQVTAAMMEGGVDILQLRAKKFIPDDVRWLAEQIHPVTYAAGVPLIINDFPEVASEVGAEGVHIGQTDISVEAARKVAGYRAIVGKSTHSVQEALEAASEEVDYLGFGPLYSTATKPDAAPVGTADIRTVYETVAKPVFCIGGIKLENLASVIESGARRVCIVSGILKADDIETYCRKVKEMLSPNWR